MVEIELRLLFGIVGLGFFGLVLELLRRRVLVERYALVWLAVGGVTALFGIFPGIFMVAARALHMHHLTLVLLVIILFLLLFSLHITIIATRLMRQIEALCRSAAINPKDPDPQ